MLPGTRRHRIKAAQNQGRTDQILSLPADILATASILVLRQPRFDRPCVDQPGLGQVRLGTRSGAWHSNTGSVVLAIVDIDGVTA